MWKSALLIIIVSVLFSCTNNKHTENLQTQTLPKDTSIIGIISDSIIHNPKNARLYADRAKIYFLKKELNLAIRDMQKAIKFDSTNIEYYNLISDYWILNGNSKPAKEYLDKAYSIDKENTGTLIRLAKLYLYVDHYEECFDYVNQAINVNPSLAMPYFVKALCYDQIGDSLKAIKNYQTAVERNPDFYDAYILLGLKYAQMKDTMAILYNNNAIRLKPNSIEAHYNQGIFMQNNGMYDRALKEYNYIINNIDSTYAQAYYNIGYMYLEYSNNIKKAIEYYKKAVKYDPENPMALYNLGLAYERNKQYKKALQAYKMSLNLAPNYNLAKQAVKRLTKKQK